MRVLAALLTVYVLAAPPAHAADGRLDWPLRPRPGVLRTFAVGPHDWNRGHRGVDLAGTTGQVVFAAADGTVAFAGELAGRPVVSVVHPGGLRTSYEPVRATVRAGQVVGRGAPIGTLDVGHAGCGSTTCLHWGAMWGPASHADYVDPLGLVVTTPIRLKPLRG